VLTLTELLRKKGVVEKFVEYLATVLASLPLADRRDASPTWRPSTAAPAAFSRSTRRPSATWKLTGRSQEEVELVTVYAKAQGLWRG